MKHTIDAVDDRILAELAKNARISHADLAKKIHLSRNAVRQRVDRLERDGLIKGYTILRGATGRQTPVAALIFVYRKDRMRGAEVISAIRSIPEVVTCEIVSGQFDLVVRIETDEAERVRALWDKISSIEGVTDTVTAFVLSRPIARH